MTEAGQVTATSATHICRVLKCKLSIIEYASVLRRLPPKGLVVDAYFDLRASINGQKDAQQVG